VEATVAVEREAVATGAARAVARVVEGMVVGRVGRKEEQKGAIAAVEAVCMCHTGGHKGVDRVFLPTDT
jgi:hypothetical protein